MRKGTEVEVVTAIFGDGAITGDRPGPISSQEARELHRIELFRRHHGLRTFYVIAREADDIIGFLPVYPVSRAFAPPRMVTGLFADLPHWSSALLLGSDGSIPSLLTARPETAGELIARALTLDSGQGPGIACLMHADDAQFELVRPFLPEAAYLGERQEAYFELPFASFEAYVATLSRNGRSQARRERRRFLDSGLELSAVPAMDAVELEPLLTQVERKYDANASAEWEALFLSSTALAMAECGTALVVHDCGRPVAFTLLWQVGSVWRVRCWGCDYAHPAVRDAALYANLMFYEPIIRAGQAGGRRLIVGTGTLESKLRRGASLRRLRSLAWEHR
ncbi:peptidogalycan biosysnthesis protein [Nonomuraea purpurea]|uniref:Peptidogalycan biosysnthesis protein n=1 Tax=Nonomuraea purpurea TaxID=1849276 RepID=A0ABV8GSA1_9ACTN